MEGILMEENYVLITQDNYAGFEGVLPKELLSTSTRFSIGAFDEEGNVLGAVSFTIFEYQYEVDWLYVEPEMRRKKIGTHLMDRVIAVATDTMEAYPISAHFTDENENALYAFFVSYDKMDINYSHERFVVAPEEIVNSPLLHSRLKENYDKRKFFAEDNKSQRNVLNYLANNSSYIIEDYDKWERACVKDLCQCIFINNKLEAAIFFQKNTDSSLELSFLFSNNPKALLHLLVSAVEEIEKNYPDYDLRFDAINEDSEKIAKKLFDSAKSVSVYEAEW